MEGFNTTNTRKAIKPLESNGQPSEEWKGNHCVVNKIGLGAPSGSTQFVGLNSVDPLNDPYAYSLLTFIYSGPQYFQTSSPTFKYCKLHIKGQTLQSVIPTELTFRGICCRFIVAYVPEYEDWDIETVPEKRMYFKDYFVGCDYGGNTSIQSIFCPKKFQKKDRIEILFDLIFRMPPEQLTAPNAVQENCLVNANELGPKIDVVVDLEGREAYSKGGNAYLTSGGLVYWLVSDDPNLSTLSTYYFDGIFELYFNCERD